MTYFNLDKKIARLIVLQRIELANRIIKKLRKIFGRYIFTNFISRFLISPESIGLKYYILMKREYRLLNNYINFKFKNILSIGPGMCGLELIINSKFDDVTFYIIEKDYVSKKVKYGWDEKNNEAYNDLDLLRSFLNKNGIRNNFKIYNFDKDTLPAIKFDAIISLYSLDYHYDFFIYMEYLKKVTHENTAIIFDTIRPHFFEKIFKNVKIITSEEITVHLSKRIICSNFIN